MIEGRIDNYWIRIEEDDEGLPRFVYISKNGGGDWTLTTNRGLDY